jgi:FlaA1/EpsC-like NDP-sugar epimerase
MTRYFMTIPEASQLVMQAAGQGSNGEIYILDMGEPVRIVDLAKDLIKLSGFEPDVDIPIAFSGVRPGEKLYEELMTNEEKGGATAHEKIFVAKPSLLELEALERTVQNLQEAALRSDHATIRRQLKAYISGALIDDVMV